MAKRFKGCYTALVTPMKGEGGEAVNYDALRRLVDFQIAEGVQGILVMGTTGESPTLSWEEHSQTILEGARLAAGRCTVIAGTGSNSTAECLASTRRVAGHGVDAVLLVEPYYNGPSSIEIRKEYMEPVAREFPSLEVIPYVIPGRTGTQLLPEDLAVMYHECSNVNTVKEASADLENMRKTRRYCGPEFTILSGDDGLTSTIMTDETIRAAGVISVVSNVAPGAVQRMTRCLMGENVDEGLRIAEALKPLFDIVTVKTQEDSPYGKRLCKARNPVPIKTLMHVLGVPVGPMRRPLGKMTPAGLEIVLQAARKVMAAAPEVLRPIGEAFDVDVEERLNNPQCWQGLAYDD